VEPRPDLFADGTGLLGRLATWAAAARVDEAVDARAREAFLRRTAGEGASFAGVLLDLAEQSGPVLLTLAGGRRHRGRLRAVGADFVVLETEQGSQVLVADRGIAAVRPDAGAPALAGDRPLTVAAGLAEALAIVAEDRPRVLLVVAGDADGLAGELRSVGQDVLVLRMDGSGRPTAYVPVANLVEVTLAG
jgi:hypothetical protein